MKVLMVVIAVIMIAACDNPTENNDVKIIDWAKTAHEQNLLTGQVIQFSAVTWDYFGKNYKLNGGKTFYVKTSWDAKLNFWAFNPKSQNTEFAYKEPIGGILCTLYNAWEFQSLRLIDAEYKQLYKPTEYHNLKKYEKRTFTIKGIIMRIDTMKITEDRYIKGLAVEVHEIKIIP